MKILIWTKNIDMTCKGGPMGYCGNIKNYLLRNPCDEIDFYPQEATTENESVKKVSFKKGISALLQKNKYTNFFVVIYRIYFKKYPLSRADEALLSKYDYVHVHLAAEILRTFQHFNNGKTKVILTTHTPEPLIDEYIDRYGVRRLMTIFPFIRRFLLKRETLAYEKCNYIMFPVPEAKEPYEHKSMAHRDVFKAVSKKFFYVPTAIDELENTSSPTCCLDKFNIPENALKLCYVGRHNTVKGYDLLKRIAQKTWEKNPDVYFIVGGKQEPLCGLDDKRWIELGWVKTSDLLNEVDAFILPNKETYFDIILLEVLRQGVPVIISRTGGNKWMDAKKIEGIHCFDYGDENGCSDIIVELLANKNNGLIEKQKKANIEFFHRELCMEKYIANYLDAVRKLG